MIFRQLFDAKSSTYTYLLACAETKDAVFIDPVFEQVNRDLALIRELELNLVAVMDTHCHADHVTGAWLLNHYTGCKIACAETIGAENTQTKLKHGDVVEFGHCHLDVRATPGHTDGCLTFVSDEMRSAFTGDALLIRGCGRCDFQQGNAAELYDSIQQQIFTLPDDFLLYPGHDYSGRTVSSVKEEKQHNTRIGGSASKDDFVGFMQNMHLPHPKFIDIALPANLKCGQPESVPERPNWAPLNLTFAGVHEVEPQWVLQHRKELTILDVRAASEFQLGHIEGAVHIPLETLEDFLPQLTNDKPLVVFCRSGRRSALAVSVMEKAQIERVANIKGGLLHWQECGLPLTAS